LECLHLPGVERKVERGRQTLNQENPQPVNHRPRSNQQGTIAEPPNSDDGIATCTQTTLNNLQSTSGSVPRGLRDKEENPRP
jgi:hypothetical protein